MMPYRESPIILSHPKDIPNTLAQPLLGRGLSTSRSRLYLVHLGDSGGGRTGQDFGLPLDSKATLS